jgi:hypothetical protein
MFTHEHKPADLAKLPLPGGATSAERGVGGHVATPYPPGVRSTRGF